MKDAKPTDVKRILIHAKALLCPRPTPEWSLMPRLQAVTIDGTVIEADQIKTQDKGIKLEHKPQGKGGNSKPETVGFVPFDRLMYVIPEDTTHNVEQLEELPA